MPKSKELQPIREKREYFEHLEDYIIKFLRQEIYIPLVETIKAPLKTLSNSIEDLTRAIMFGQIQHVNGHFEGKFNATISKELKKMGAVWDKKNRWWKTNRADLTYDVLALVAVSEYRHEQMLKKVDRQLAKVVPKELADKMKMDKLFDSTIYRVNKDFNESVKTLEIKSQLTDEQKKRISEEYTKNMKLYITDFTQKEIEKLRREIRDNSYAGGRYESMIKTIQESYGVSQNKAKFLARQETSLLMTKFKQVRYQSAGINKYKWKCVIGSPAHPVRPMHKALDGKIQTWDNPPIASQNGDRKHPGQDFNCRCIAIPIVEF